MNSKLDLRKGKREPENILFIFTGLVLLFTVIVRLNLLHLPLDRDEGEYAYAGWRMLEGDVPFRDFYNMKMPGIYGAYSILLMLFGATLTAVRIGALLINLINTLFVFLLARQWGNRKMAAYSACCFLIFSFQAELQGFYTHAEQWALLFALPALLLIARAWARNSRFLFFISGLSAGISFLMKQPALMYVVSVILIVVLEGYFRKKNWTTTMSFTGIVIAGSAVPFLLTSTLLWLKGAGPNYLFFAFDYARQYIHSTDWNWGFSNFRLVVAEAASANPMVWILIPWFAILLFLRTPVRTGFLTLFFLFSFAAVCPGLYFRPHYFQFVVPAISLLSGAVLFTADLFVETRMKKNSGWRWLVPGYLVLSVGLFFLLDRNKIPLFNRTEFERLFDSTGMRHASLKVGEVVAANSKPGDRVGILGAQPEVWFYAKRKAASGYLYVYPLLENHPFAVRMQQQYLQETAEAQPEVLVYYSDASTWYASEPVHRQMREWFEGYRGGAFQKIALIDLVSDTVTNYYDKSEAGREPMNPENFIEIWKRY